MLIFPIRLGRSKPKVKKSLRFAESVKGPGRQGKDDDCSGPIHYKGPKILISLIV